MLASLSLADVTALIGAIIAVAGAVYTLLRSILRAIRADLEACLRDRTTLRRDLMIVQGALLGLLPEASRLSLLRQLSDAIEPHEGGEGRAA